MIRGGGTPGGNNGNPCPSFCEPVGGEIWCVGTVGNTHYFYPDNCSNHPDVPGLHNKCLNDATGDFWC